MAAMGWSMSFVGEHANMRRLNGEGWLILLAVGA